MTRGRVGRFRVTVHFALYTLHLGRGRGRKVMHLPCKQAETGALPVGLHHFIFHCGENEIQASLSSASVGATPTPATSLSPKPESPKTEGIPKVETRK